MLIYNLHVVTLQLHTLKKVKEHLNKYKKQTNKLNHKKQASFTYQTFKKILPTFNAFIYLPAYHIYLMLPVVPTYLDYLFYLKYLILHAYLSLLSNIECIPYPNLPYFLTLPYLPAYLIDNFT